MTNVVTINKDFENQTISELTSILAGLSTNSSEPANDGSKKMEKVVTITEKPAQNAESKQLTNVVTLLPNFKAANVHKAQNTENTPEAKSSTDFSLCTVPQTQSNEGYQQAESLGYFSVSKDETLAHLHKNFIVHKNGIYDTEGSMITNFIVEDKILIRDGEGNLFYSFYVRTGNEKFQIHKITISEFRSGTWYKPYPKLACFNMSLFQLYLETMVGEGEVAIQYLFTKNGWYIPDNGKAVFITPYGDVAGDLPNAVVESSPLQIYPMQNVSEKEIANHAFNMRNLTSNLTALVIQIYTILASLFSLFARAGYKPKGSLMVVGPRSSLKTSLALVMAKLVDRKVGMSPKYNFLSTPASIEDAFVGYKDSVLIVDDLMPTEDKPTRDSLEKTLEYATRVFGDGVQKQRSVKYTGGNVPQPCGLALFTAEYIAGVSSSQVRRMHVYLEKDTVNRDLLTWHQNNLGLLSTFFWNFLKYCANNQGEIIQYIQTMFIMNRNSSNVYFSDSPRYADHVGFMQTAYGILLKYFAAVGTITEETIPQFETDFYSKFVELMIENYHSQEESNPFQQIIESFTYAFNTDRQEFAHVDSSEKKENYFDDEYFYLSKEWLLDCVISYMHKQGKMPAISDTNYLRSVLKRENALVSSLEGDGNRYSLKVPHGEQKGDRRRLWKIPKKVILIDL